MLARIGLFFATVISLFFFTFQPISAQSGCWNVQTQEVVGCDCRLDENRKTYCVELTKSSTHQCCANQYIPETTLNCDWETGQLNWVGNSSIYCGSQEDTGGGTGEPKPATPDCAWDIPFNS